MFLKDEGISGTSMQVKEHILYGGAVSVTLYPFFGLKTLFFFIGSVLIDIDHYIDYLYYGRFKNWSIKTMFKFHGMLALWRHNPNIYALEAFHTAEFLLLFLGVAYYFSSAELFLFFAGMIFHLILDFIRLKQWGRVKARAFSFIEYWIRTGRMKRSGVNPEKIFEEAYLVASRAVGT